MYPQAGGLAAAQPAERDLTGMKSGVINHLLRGAAALSLIALASPASASPAAPVTRPPP